MNQNVMTALSWVFNGITILSSLISENPVAQWILFGLGIFSSLLSIALSVLKVHAKWKEINEDGKITKEELEELNKTIDNAKTEIKEQSEKSDNK